MASHRETGLYHRQRKPTLLHPHVQPALTWLAAFHDHTPVSPESEANARVFWYHPKDVSLNSAMCVPAVRHYTQA